MGIKRKIEDNVEQPEKKTKLDETFPMETFVKNLKDPESCFLALSEFNEHARRLSPQEKLDALMDDFLQRIQSNLDDVLGLITEEKRKSSENTTLYRFLTTLLEYFSAKNAFALSEMILKKFLSTSNSIYTIYFMLSNHSTASHLKITLRFLLALVQQNEFSARSIFSLIDFKRPCWRGLLKRRDVRDSEDVRFWLIKFFFSPLIYQHPDTIRNLIKEQDVLHEIFSGLVYDSRQTVEFVLHELRTNVIMVSGVSKTDKIHLFDDRNLKSLIRLYNWTGQQRRKDMKKLTRKKNLIEQALDTEEMDTSDNGDRDELRRTLHEFMIILFNSKYYGIQFFDPHFGTSTKNANPILLKVITNVSNHFLTDDYAANLIVTCLSTSPDLLPAFYKLIVQEYIGLRSKSTLGAFEFLCEALQQQKPLTTWLEIFQTTSDAMKLADMLIHLTLPLDIMNKFEQIIAKNADENIQLVAMKFLSLVLERVQAALNLILHVSLACDRVAAMEAYQQAILRYIPRPDHFCDSLSILKTVDSTASIGQYINLLKLYSSSCFMSMSAMNINLDVLLSNSLLNLLSHFKEILSKQELDDSLIENYFQCMRNILNYRESIDDATWARQNKDLQCTPIRMLFKLVKRFKNIDHIADHLASVMTKFSSMISDHHQELIIWFYTWLKLGASDRIEEFLSHSIEKIILNPYPLLEKTIKDTSRYSLMIYSALDSIQHAKEDLPTEINDYLSHVVFQIYLGHNDRSPDQLHQYLKAANLKSKKDLKIYPLLESLSSPSKQNQVLTREIDQIEKLILANIDLSRGPDDSQINLAVKLNIFKMFSLDGGDQPRLIKEIVQCFNIVLLLDESRRAFEPVFDRAIDCIQSYASAVDNDRRISLICQCINGLDVLHWTPKPLRHANVLLDCLRYQPDNARLIRFAANYLPRDSRMEFLNMICQKSIADPEILTIIIEEIQADRNVHDGKFLDLILDHLKDLNEALPQGIECILELIDRAKKASNTDWKNLLRLKQKHVFRLIKTDYPRVQTRVLVAKLISRTIGALRSTDRADAIQRLIPKSDHGLLTFAHLANDLLVGKESIDTELFSEYLHRLISKHSSESIVLQLLRQFCEQNPDEKDRILQLLQIAGQTQDDLPRAETNQLLLLLQLFPESVAIVEPIYESLVQRTTAYFQTSQDNHQSIDDWLTSFEQCTQQLRSQTKISCDLYDLINRLLKSFETFTAKAIQLLKTLIDVFVSQESFNEKHLAKLFARFLKHPNFLEQLSSSNRSILVDVLAVLVTHYKSTLPSVTIDCAKHYPMLLSTYSATLSKSDQHTLACMYAYEKSGYSMRWASVWGDAALKSHSATKETKSVLFEASQLEQVMNLLDDRMMMKSILAYPVTRRLRTLEPAAYEQGELIYDPAYLIPLFYHSLAPECVVKCQQFVEKHCLTYCVMALSSRCGLLRAVVYNCLSRFEQHLIAQKFYCKEQIFTMLALLKQSIKKPNLKLAPIVALFLSKLVDLFTHPESKMYRTITRFLLKQPFIDLVHIPLFGELFHSTSGEYKYERGWILNLLKHGIKDSIDYTLCTKAYVFKTLMTFYECSLSDDGAKLEILHVFHATSKLQDVLMSLLFDYGFLLWLQVIVKTCSSDSLVVLTSIIENIGTRLTSVDNHTKLLEFDALLLLFVRRLKSETPLSSSIADTVVSTVIKHQTCLQVLDNNVQASVDLRQMKYIVDRSTVAKENPSLLSRFC